jgi:hypothetical protein
MLPILNFGLSNYVIAVELTELLPMQAWSDVIGTMFLAISVDNTT